ncbi:MAG: nuclease [Candidatus Cloacimonetes bacterium HGW-Cloacimonetes-3]|jgi:endonuclease YncB( thermonuclease family)|nr:MAG: nuclease [Candidatus Cloacimonetes bacterium HGW-Cloacimonetes-3]
MKQFTITLLLLGCLAVSMATTVTGKVVGVMDGDTIEILSNRQTYRIRLDGIDCPEKNQAFGTVAKQVTSQLCFGMTVKAKVTDKDRYGRFVARVILPSGGELNATLIKNGYAWHYKQYSKDSYYASLETSARIERRGLWADINPIPPWEYRRGVTSKKAVSPITGLYMASVNSRVFHKPSCEQAKRIKAANRRWFQTRVDAVKQGYKACKYCKP